MRLVERLRTIGIGLVFAAAAMTMSASLNAQAFSSSHVTNAGEVPALDAIGDPASASPAVVGPDAMVGHLPFEYGAIVQGGFGATENRDDFKFIMAGVHAGKVLYTNNATGMRHGNFEYAMELFPYWQSFTPKFQRASCVPLSEPNTISCSPLYIVGGTFSGITVTPIILRWNFAGGRRIKPWAQAAGGLLWTDHKYPAFGSTILNVQNDGPNADASVWNFTPQGGVGVHYFFAPTHSIDFGANAVHISSASLGDRNPGVNVSIQFLLGYSFWR